MTQGPQVDYAWQLQSVRRPRRHLYTAPKVRWTRCRTIKITSKAQGLLKESLGSAVSEIHGLCKEEFYTKK